jgi:hypothetical protein
MQGEEVYCLLKINSQSRGSMAIFVHNKDLPLVMRAWRTVNKLFFMVVCVSCDNQVNRACLVRQIDFEVMSKFRQFAGN